MPLKVTGLAGVVENLHDLANNGADALGAAIYAQGLSILADAQKMVPVDTGRLRASGYVDAPKVQGDKAVVVVGFGTDYALAVHEAPGTLKGEPRANGRGLYWDPQGQAEPKFLEKAINRHKGSFDAEALSLLEKFLETGVGIQVIESPEALDV